jgi:hypothetical protein
MNRSLCNPRRWYACYSRRRQVDRRGKVALLSGLVLFLFSQFSLAFTLEHWRPDLRDPEFGHKLARLRARLEEQPGRPLVVVLGSSRTGVGLRPEQLNRLSLAGGQTPIVFNFGLTASGPIMERLCLQRLLEEGIHPDWLVVEVMAPLLNQKCAGTEGADWIDARRATWSDLSLLRRFLAPVEQAGGSSEETSQAMPLYWQWCQARLLPWFTQRMYLLSHYAPNWVPWNSRQDLWQSVDRSGWLPYMRDQVAAEEYRRGLENAHREYAPRLTDFEVTEVPDRALREILDVCRHERITPILMLMPEASEFRHWFSPEAEVKLDQYLAALSEEYEVSLIDARSWMIDTDFTDGHHLLPSGATAFTERFGSELYPLLGDNRPIVTALTIEDNQAHYRADRTGLQSGRLASDPSPDPVANWQNGGMPWTGSANH